MGSSTSSVALPRPWDEWTELTYVLVMYEYAKIVHADHQLHTRRSLLEEQDDGDDNHGSWAQEIDALVARYIKLVVELPEIYKHDWAEEYPNEENCMFLEVHKWLIYGAVFSR